MVGAGLSSLDAIRAATINAAAAFRLQDSIGTIRPGMVADIVAVRGDPLVDITTLMQPVLVVSRGRIVSLVKTASARAPRASRPIPLGAGRAGPIESRRRQTGRAMLAPPKPEA